MPNPTVRAFTTFGPADVSPGTVTLPTGTASGDQLVMIVAADGDADTGNFTFPTGFTIQGRVLAPGTLAHYPRPCLLVATKTATGSEPSTYSLVIDTNSDTVGALIAVQDGAFDTFSIVDDGNVQQSTRSTAAITTTAAGDLVIQAYVNASPQTWTGPSGTTVVSNSIQSTKYHSTTLGVYYLSEASIVTAKTYAATTPTSVYGMATAIAFKAGASTTPVLQTRQLVFNTLKGITQTRQEVWNVLAATTPVLQTRQFVFNDQAKVPATTRQLVFNDLSLATPVAKTAALKWNVLAPPPFPAGVSTNKRFLVDQYGAPYFVVGDGQWTMCSRVPSSTDRATYFTNRKANGYNGLTLDVIDGPLKFNPTTDPTHFKTLDGLYPFGGTNHDDITSLTTTYWSRMDTIIDEAASYGMTAWMTVANGQDMIGVLRAAGTTNCHTYGLALGNRWKTKSNIVWLLGEDYTPGGSDDAYILAVLQGIKDSGDTHLVTMEQNYQYSISHDGVAFRSKYDFEWVYSYPAVYDETRLAYAVNDGPVLMGESKYENEGAVNLTLRKEAGWAVTNGALAGLFKGNNPVWNIPIGGVSTSTFGTWSANTNTTADVQLGKIRSWFTGLGAWTKLAPDTGNIFLTGGAGTYKNTSTSTSNDDSDYATAALSSDATTGVVYLPAARTITVDTTRIGAYTGAVWVDASDTTHTVSPTTGGTPSAKTFTHPGNNNDGDPDWFLLLTGSGPAPVVATRQLVFNTNTKVTQTRQTVWNTAAATPPHAVGVNSHIIWNTIGPFPVVQSAQLVWNDLALTFQVLKQAALLWGTHVPGGMYLFTPPQTIQTIQLAGSLRVKFPSSWTVFKTADVGWVAVETPSQDQINAAIRTLSVSGRPEVIDSDTAIELAAAGIGTLEPIGVGYTFTDDGTFITFGSGVTDDGTYITIPGASDDGTYLSL